MAFHTKTHEAYGNIRGKPNQPFNYLNRGHKSKANIFGQYLYYTSENCKLGADIVHTAYVYNVVYFQSI